MKTECSAAYRQALEFLYGLRVFGTKLGLENTKVLAELAGNPHQNLRFIHVAGTNGKGSTCALLESIYRATGLRVGLFTSPHLISFRERIQIDRRLVSEADIVRLVEEMIQLTHRLPEDRHPTFFEVVTVMALRYFKEQECDLVIWETGLGGRLDATNIVTPLASVITNIHYDHQKWLGSTLASIAGEKAGIIKPGVPVISGVAEPEALEVIVETARERSARLIQPDLSSSCMTPGEIPDLPLLGAHQRQNAALALATVNVLQSKLPVSREQLNIGIKSLSWPGRLQLVTRPSGQKILLDGAHNVAGANALSSAIREHFPAANPTLIFGVLDDKDLSGICAAVAPLARRILLVPVHSERTVVPEDLVTIFKQHNPQAEICACKCLSEALANSAADPLVIVTGSLYLVGEALELVESPSKASGERGLNEWGDSRMGPKP
jgi:dihydrofolate synthase / folylpolyglutamate synthase